VHDAVFLALVDQPLFEIVDAAEDLCRAEEASPVVPGKDAG
jgi:hypothetical protein